jgi:ATP-dependent exoDNAse (exonuclease V) beta subunit
VHRALETLDLYGDPACELERQKERLSLYVRPLVAPELLDRTVTRSRALLERLSRGRLFERLFALREQVMARELPLYVPAESDGDGVVGFVAGAVDMVYRDAGAGRIVAVDYKTDQVTTPEEIAERTRVYADQGRVYVEALHRALALEQQPRFELWFLQADRMEALSFS